jgi:two-component system response regulator MprA
MPVILVVDDDPNVRSMLESVLQASGYTVVSAGGGLEALAICTSEGQAIDVVVTDVTMPELSGIEMVSIMRANGINAPVLYISGDQRVDGELCLLKPFTTQSLLEFVAKLLEPDSAPS